MLIKPSHDGATPLQGADLDFIRSLQKPQGIPVRFMFDGCATDIVTGDPKDDLQYLNFDRETARIIAASTGTTPLFTD